MVFFAATALAAPQENQTAMIESLITNTLRKVIKPIGKYQAARYVEGGVDCFSSISTHPNVHITLISGFAQPLAYAFKRLPKLCILSLQPLSIFQGPFVSYAMLMLMLLTNHMRISAIFHTPKLVRVTTQITKNIHSPSLPPFHMILILLLPIQFGINLVYPKLSSSAITFSSQSTACRYISPMRRLPLYVSPQ